jgi:hypothetical protein
MDDDRRKIPAPFSRPVSGSKWQWGVHWAKRYSTTSWLKKSSLHLNSSSAILLPELHPNPDKSKQGESGVEAVRPDFAAGKAIGLLSLFGQRCAEESR